MDKDKDSADFAFSYAPGKAILVGEHAAVYGAQAIAMPIDVGVRVMVSYLPDSQRGTGPIIRGVGPYFMGDISMSPHDDGPGVLKSALNYLLESFGNDLTNIAMVVDGSLPPGRGLGSSASLSVALLRGIFRFFNWDLCEEVLKAHAHDLETIFHGRPSGIDHSVIIYGNVIGFRRQGEQAHHWPIPLKTALNFVVGIAGPHEGTKVAVQKLSERKKRHERVYQTIFSAIDEVAKEMEQALIAGKLASVGELMNIAQGYLNALMVSTPEIEKLCAIAKDRGALGAKLTGAGGGGSVIALVDGNETDLINAFRAAGYQSFSANVAQTAYKNCEIKNLSTNKKLG